LKNDDKRRNLTLLVIIFMTLICNYYS